MQQPMKRFKLKRERIQKRAAKLKVGLLLATALITLMTGCSSGNNNQGNNSSSENASNTATNDTGNAASSDAADNSSSANKADNSSSSNSNSSTSDSTAAPDKPAADDTDRTDTKDSHDETGNSQYDSSQPGQLTAGEWDDLGEWKRWKKLLQGNEGADNESYWSMFPENRLEVIVTGGGKPVPDADVSIVDEDGETIWEAHTNMDGEAYAFAGLFDEQGTDDTYGVVVQSGNSEKRYENVPIPRDSALKIDLDASAKIPSALDLMLVVDTTGSMEDELNYLKTELKDVVERVGQDNGQQLDIRVSANFYRDKNDAYVVRDFPFTGDIDDVVKQLGEQKAAGGGDFPEAVDQALDNAINEHKWSNDARARLLFLVMDAPPHHDRKVTKHMHELIETASAEAIRIIPVASSGVDVSTEYLMRFIAAATGGTYLFLTDHSGIGNDHLKPAVGEFEVKALNDLLVDVINRYTS
ncbi:VWA domain-containing protein [Paenibacillus sp. OV219]|uniref:vWA domain-containing protein n=1 Tax=Paenibacillus sp. OV219 TaxID=1884377 RepID=UPI0008C644B5|nr:VWA domain-containing protein [Paenibacillus sp. OV219]SEN78895.1 Mg-chelatase subunit ChlD [Paenibacillus sp. OV219]